MPGGGFELGLPDGLVIELLARKSGVHIEWKQHALTGIPVTLGTLVLVWAWLR